jgi:hypothetical protein
MNKVQQHITELISKELRRFEDAAQQNSVDTLEMVSYYEKLHMLSSQKRAEIELAIASKLLQEQAFEEAAAIFEAHTHGICSTDTKKKYIYCLVHAGFFEKAVQEVARFKPTFVPAEHERPEDMRMHEIYLDFLKAKAFGGQKKYSEALSLLRTIDKERKDNAVQSLIFYYSFVQEMECSQPQDAFFLEASKQHFAYLDEEMHRFRCTEEALMPSFEFYVYAIAQDCVRQKPSHLQHIHGTLHTFMQCRRIPTKSLLSSLERSIQALKRKTDEFFALFQRMNASIVATKNPQGYTKAILDARVRRIHTCLFGEENTFDGAGILQKGMAYSALIKDAKERMNLSQDHDQIQFINLSATLMLTEEQMKAYQKNSNALYCIDSIRHLLPEPREEKNHN